MARNLSAMPTNKRNGKETRVARSVRFTDSEWRSVKNMAKGAKMTVSKFIRVAIGLGILIWALTSCDNLPLEVYPQPSVFFDRMPRCRALEGRSVPLQKAHLTIPLAGGLASNVDPKQLPIGGNLELQNTRAGRVGEVVPRSGTIALGTGLLGTSDTLPAPWSLATWKDCLVSLSGVGKHPLNVWAPTAAKWATDVVNASTFAQEGGVRSSRRGPVGVSTSRVANIGSRPAIAYGGGYYFVGWIETDAAGGNLVVHEEVIEAATGVVVIQRVFNDSLSAATIGVAYTNGYGVFARSTNASDIKFDAWQASNLTAGPTTATLATTQNVASGIFDVIAKDSTTVSMVFADTGTGNLSAADFVPSTATITAWVPKNAAAASIASAGAVRWMQDLGGSGKIALITGDGGNINVQWDIPTAGATRQAATTYLAAAATGGAVAGNTIGSLATGEWILVYDSTNPVVTPGTSVVMRNSGGAIVGPTVFYGSVQLTSNTFKQGTDFYVWLEYYSNSGTQGVRYLARVETNYLGTGAPGPGGILAKAQVNAATGGGTSYVVSPSSNTWTMATSVYTRINGQSTVSWSQGIDLVTASFKQVADTTMGTPREAIDSLFVSGGNLGQFDGFDYMEAGFAYYPEAARISLTPAGGGALTAGATYYYKVVYAHTDRNGRVWRSAPSLVTSVAMGANTKVTVGGQTLQISDRSLAGVTQDKVRETIEIYRGGANDNNTFALVAAIANDVSVATFSYVDTSSDVSIATHEFLYTNGGGALANDPIPGSTSIAVAANRLFTVSADDSQVIWPSAPFVPGLGLRFSEQTKVAIRDQHGPIYGLAAQPNGTVLAFKKDAVYLISGSGPDQAGRGSFTVSIVAIGLGTTNPRSIVETSQGAEFLSTSTRAGWYRINLGQAPEYIGGPVESYVGQTIVGAIMIADRTETRYYLAAGGCLVHDIKTGMWSVDTGNAATSAAAWGSLGAYGTSTPSVIVDNTGGTTDPTLGAFTMKATTPWVNLGDLRGYERMYKARGVGELQSGENSGALTTIALQKNLIVADVVSQTAQAAPAGVGSTWDWEMRYSAKFEAARFVVSCVPDTFDTPSAIKWSAIVLEYGIRPGMRPAASSTRTT